MSDAIEQADSVKEALDRYSGWVAWADELHKTEPKTIAWPYDGMGDDSAKIARAVARDRIGFILSLLPGPEWEKKQTIGNHDVEYYVWTTAVGTFLVRRLIADWSWVLVECGEREPCPSLESGQAACRADYERRVAEIFNLTKGDGDE